MFTHYIPNDIGTVCDTALSMQTNPIVEITEQPELTQSPLEDPIVETDVVQVEKTVIE